jgi:hypothetical protein
LKIDEVQVGGPAFLDDDDLDLPTEPPGFAKKMDSEKRAGRSTANNGDTITVQQACRLILKFHFGFPALNENNPRWHGSQSNFAFPQDAPQESEVYAWPQVIVVGATDANTYDYPMQSLMRREAAVNSLSQPEPW